jgi:hypothetical protein
MADDGTGGDEGDDAQEAATRRAGQGIALVRAARESQFETSEGSPPFDHGSSLP